MKKLLKSSFVLFCILLLSAHTSYAFESRNDEVVSADKVWNIQFNKELKYDDALKQSITVVDSVGTIIAINLELGKDMQSILINPPAKGYTLGKMYTLKIAADIYSKDNMKLQEPIQMNFKINNNVLVENNENLKVVFNDNCSSILDSGWSKSLDNSQQSFIADFSEHDNYNSNVPYGQYLFYNSSQNSIMQLSKNVEIGAGPFNIEFDAKIVDLQTPSKNSGWRGFTLDAIANNKRYRFSFNSKDSDNKIKINLMNKASGDGSFQTVDAYLPKDDNIHRWSIKNDGNNNISVLIDGTNIASFIDPQLVSTDINDRVVLYNDMNDAATGTNQIYIENFAITKSLTIKALTVIADENNQTVNASISMTIEDEKLIVEKHYIIKCSLYKNDQIVAEATKTLDNKNISFSLNNITQSGEMKVVATIIAVDKKIDEMSKMITLNVASINLEPGQTISSQPGKVYLYNNMDKMIATGQNDAQHSGWELETYTDYSTNNTGTILENVENALPISVPVKLNGWFRVYIGYVTGTESFKIGQTDGSSQLQIKGDISLASSDLYGDQFINEKSTIVSNFNNSSIKIYPNPSQRARVAYIKLVGLTQDQITIYGKPSENKKTILYDFDGYSGFFDGSYPDVETFKNRTVDVLSGRNVGELNWCLGTTGMLNYNSKFAGNALEGLEIYDDQLRAGDKLAKYQILNILSSGKSPLEILADRGKEKGMKVNASLRMDTFYNPLVYGFLNGAMYNEYNKFTQTGTYELDYKYPEVRTYIKNILLEAASFNNVSGITLDFCRYPTLFGPESSNEQKILIMNEFLRSLKRELPTNKTITIRVPYNEPLKYGYDINTWIKEGLIDRLIPSSISREEYFNIKPYVDMVKNTNVQLYIGISADVSGHDITKEEEELIKQGLYINNKVYLNVQQYLLRAYDVYKSGADGVFLFNSSSGLLVDNNAPIESTFIGDESLLQKWREFDYESGFMINKINVQTPTF